MTIFRAHTAGVLVLAALAIGSFATPAAAEPPPQVTVTATDNSLDLPDEVEAGLLAFRYENAGTLVHNVLFLRLHEGKTLQDFRAARGPEDLPGLATPAGGTTSVLAGQQRLFLNDLAPGNYVAFSTSTGPDGVPDTAKGLVRPLTVVPSTRATPPDEPAAGLAITLRDAALIPVPVTLAAGPQTWRVTVEGTTLHEMTVVRLAPGKTVADSVAFLSGGRRGPPPGEPVAGMQLLPPGQRGWLVFELEPGEYTVNDIPGGGPLTAPVGHFTVLASAAPAQVPGALPRTGDAPSSLPGALAVGTVLVALGLALRRRLGRGPGTGARSAR